MAVPVASCKAENLQPFTLQSAKIDNKSLSDTNSTTYILS